MTRWLTLSLLITATATVGCSPGVRIIDGGRVDADGWPVRTLESQPYRCPEGTELIDNLAPSGRRVVMCRKQQNPLPRGFQLTWNDTGRLVSQLVLTAQGVPVTRTQWFDNGRKSGEESYQDGKLIRQVAWYENGEQRADLAYDVDRDIMIVERYQPDGAIESQGQTRNGRRIGAWREWRDGALEEVEFVDGLQHGKTIRSYPSGGVEHGQYDAGAKVGKWVRLDGNGRPVREASWTDGHPEGLYRTFHPNTQIREEGHLLNGKRVGIWKTWFPSGELESEHWYVCDVRWGPTKTYYPSGKVHTKGLFENGRKVGEWQVLSESGIETEIDTHSPVTRRFSPKDIPKECPDRAER